MEVHRIQTPLEHAEGLNLLERTTVFTTEELQRAFEVLVRPIHSRLLQEP